MVIVKNVDISTEKIKMHRLGMWFYLLGYKIWLRLGKKMYWDDMMLVRENVFGEEE